MRTGAGAPSAVQHAPASNDGRGHVKREPVTHPITGLPFDYDRCCNQCVHFSDKTRTLRGDKFRTIKCALDPEQRNLGNDKTTAWWALPGCTEHRRLAG